MSRYEIETLFSLPCRSGRYLQNCPEDHKWKSERETEQQSLRISYGLADMSLEFLLKAFNFFVELIREILRFITKGRSLGLVPF